jgi:hypothetical protein
VTSYLFYGYNRTYEDGEWIDKWTGLFDARPGSTLINSNTINVKAVKEGNSKLGDVIFNYNDNDATGAYPCDKNFFFVSSDPSILKVAATTKDKDGNVVPAPATETTLEWVTDANGYRKTGKVTLTVIAANYVDTWADVKKDAPRFEFAIEVRAQSVALSIEKEAYDYNIVETPTNDAGEVTGGRAWTKKELEIAKEFLASYGSDLMKYDVVTRKVAFKDEGTELAKLFATRIGLVRSTFAGKKTYVTYPDADGKKTANVPVDVKFNLKFDPANDGKNNVDQNFIGTVEGHVAGFTFDFSTDAVGSHEAIKQYAQDKPGDSRPATYLDWNKKEGSVKVTISAVKDSGKKITPIDYIKNANTTLNFKINKEDKVLIEVTEVKDGKEVKADVKVAEKESIDIYNITGKTTRIKITDKEGNKIEPTYANGYADLEWYSGDSTIARVTKDGRITGIKAGFVTVYAQGKYEKGEIQVEVTGPQKTETKVRFNQPDPAKYEIPVKSTRPMSAYVITDPIRSYDYTVESSDPTIVSVSKTGTVDGKIKPDTTDDVDDHWFITGVNKGTAFITVTPTGWDKGITAEFTVTDDIAGYSFNKDTYTVAKGKTVTLYGKTNPLDAAFDVNDYTFIIDDTSIAYLNSTGKNVEVYGYNPGTTKITVTNIYNPQVTATATIVVEGLKAESIVMKKDSVNLNYVEMNKDDVSRFGVYFRNYVKFTPSAANATISGREFETWTFESDDEGVAIVDTTGYITATGVGKAVITGTYGAPDQDVPMWSLAGCRLIMGTCVL